MPDHNSSTFRLCWSRIVALGLVAAAFVGLAGYAQEGDDVEWTHDFLGVEQTLSTNFVTPHTEWAKPYAGGTVKALFFAPWFEGSTDAREIIELMERCDLDAKAVYVLNNSHLVGDKRPDWYGGNPRAGTVRALRLLDHANDVLFINHLSLAALPKELRDRIRQKVIGGAGLVLVGNSNQPPFGNAQPFEPKPSQPKAGRFYTVGKGRVVLLPRREKLEYRLGWETQFDYQMEQQVRALLWVANREPKFRMDLKVPQKVVRADLPAAATLTWQDAVRGTKLKLVLRRWDGVKNDLPPVNAGAANSASIPIPTVREGDYHLDVFATKNGAIENWATSPFHVEADRHVEAVHLDEDWAEVGEAAKGQVRLAGKLQPQDRVLVRLVDKHGRMLVQKDFPASDAAIPFTFAVESWMPMLLRVEAAIHDGPDEVSANYAYLRVTKRHQNQFNFVVWCYPSGDLAPYGVQSLARNGVTAILQQGPPGLCLAENELSYIPYTTSFRASSHTITAMLNPTNGVLKTGCVYDVKKMAESVRQVVKGAEKARESGVLAYSLGDENAVRASCLSPECLVAYHRYLKEAYGTIDALNQEWNAKYQSFDDIELLSKGELPTPDAPTWFKEYFAERQELHRTDNEGAKGDDLERQIALGNVNDEMRALQAGNYPRWYDRQAFQCYTYVQWCKQFQRAFHELDPKARTGFEGTDSFSLRQLTTRSRQGGDLDLFVRDLDYFGPYGGPANEVVRSIAPANFPMGNWMGYDPGGEALLHDYWGQITTGMNTVQWWRWDNLDGYHGYLMPTLVPFPAVRELLNDTQVVRDGLGDLLMRSQMQDDGIAMLYSMPSTYIAFFDGNASYRDYKRDHERWINLIHGAGLQFRYVTDRMLRLGQFDAARYKALILPLAFALGEKEAAVIRDFVRNGGTIIADLRPGLYDGHCKPLERGLLDDVFGIKRTGKQDAMGIDRMSVDGDLNGIKVQMKWGNWHGHDIYPRMKIDPTVALSTGKALGLAFHIHYWAALNTPVCIVNDFGKGHAVLLNFSVFDSPAGSLIAELLASAGVRPAIHVNIPNGRYPEGVTLNRWSSDQIELMSLFGKYQGNLNVSLPAPRFVYELKSHRTLGETSAFTLSLRPNRAAFVALLPKSSPPPDLKLPVFVRRGSVVSASIRIPDAAGQHAVRIHATTPAGTTAEWLDQTLIVGDQPVALKLPFAYNDPVGQWQIHATDLYGNHTTTASISLR